MHLLILDVDGTLVHSLAAEAELFPVACERALGLSDVSCDWDSYRCPSDTGIVRELVETRLGRRPMRADFQRVEQAFLALIRTAYAEQPELCRPVNGAIEAMHRFRQSPDLALALATAGWHLTATHKLSVAGLGIDDLPIATSHDAEEKLEIMRVAASRAAVHMSVTHFDSVICFGDSAGDALAAAELGYGFIGIDTSGFVADARHRFPDFSALDHIIGAIRELQRGTGSA
jgi:phosphoglycolate phosphatase-like HAD superfamily hydrolase